MTKLICSIAFAILSTLAYSQSQIAYSAISETENFILDRYEIDYTGPHTRHMVVHNAFSKSIDTLVKESMVSAYNRFVAWNAGKLSIIPDTFKALMTGEDYLYDKLVPEYYHLVVNSNINILQKYRQEINDSVNNMKTIEIIETFNTLSKNGINHLIFIERYDGTWEIITPDYSNSSLVCPQCPAE